MINYYKVLGVPDCSNNQEIRIAYRKLSKKFHPDLNNGDKFFEEKFREIQEAYDFLNIAENKSHLDDYINVKNNSYNSTGFQDSNSKAAETFYNGQKNTKNTNNSFGYILVFIGIIIFSSLIIVNQPENINKNPNEIIINEEGSTSEKQNDHSQYETYKDPNANPNDFENFDINSEYQVYQRKFSIGSSVHEVVIAQGIPTSKEVSKYDNGEIWYYDFSTIKFKDGRVNEYSNYSKNLNIVYKDATTYGDNGDDNLSNMNNFSMGSNKNEVLKAQGTPSSTRVSDYDNGEVWHYDFSTVTFKDGTVREYSNLSKNLNVRY